MIRITDKATCCGCTACASACPKGCIQMIADAEGFKYPSVDLDMCIDCGLCEKVCPMIHPDTENRVMKVYSAKHNDESIRKTSSSGGAFSSLATSVIRDGGVVVGCALDDHLVARHIVVKDEDTLKALRSSKYVQSEMEGIFQTVKGYLKEGKKVLFSGTPCQVAGLRRFLVRGYDNLLCVDVLCHGVPSPKLCSDYLHKKEAEVGSSATSLNFRNKQKGWKRLFIEVRFENGKRYFKFSGFDPYMSLFLNNKSQRASCFHCPFATLHRQGDISLGDFWGIGRRYPDYDDDKGISMILVNNEKGVKLFDWITPDLRFRESDVDLALAGNRVLKEPILGEESRNRFYADYIRDGYDAATKKYALIPPVWKQHYYTAMRFCLDIVRMVTRKGY